MTPALREERPGRIAAAAAEFQEPRCASARAIVTGAGVILDSTLIALTA